jgi:hypothetical protein
MRRREFMIVTAGRLATIAAAQALAQKPAKPARVGYVWIGTRGSSPDLDGLFEGFADLGYAAGRNLLLEERYADGHPERLPALLAELLALNVDVLLTPGFQATRAAQLATSTVPIVSVSDDPVGAGLVASLSRPGGNITGLSLLPDGGSVTWLELVKEANPTLHRVAVLWSQDSPVLVRDVERMRKAAPKLGLDVTAFSVRPQEIAASRAAIATARPDGLVVCDVPFFFSIRRSYRERSPRKRRIAQRLARRQGNVDAAQRREAVADRVGEIGRAARPLGQRGSQNVARRLLHGAALSRRAQPQLRFQRVSSLRIVMLAIPSGLQAAINAIIVIIDDTGSKADERCRRQGDRTRPPQELRRPTRLLQGWPPSAMLTQGGRAIFMTHWGREATA